MRKIPLEVDGPKSSLRLILKEGFGFQKLFGMLVPHLVSEHLKILRSNICYDNLISLRRHPNLLPTTLAIDEI